MDHPIAGGVTRTALLSFTQMVIMGSDNDCLSGTVIKKTHHITCRSNAVRNHHPPDFSFKILVISFCAEGTQAIRLKSLTNIVGGLFRLFTSGSPAFHFII
ncbi:hypothetical protein D9M69_661560 [compost metagenome]